METPGYGPPPVAQGKDRTTLFGWLGIVLGLCCLGLLGIIFGALSLQQARRYSSSRTLGIIAVVIGVIRLIGDVVGLVIRVSHN
jgi:hypothetical protein